MAREATKLEASLIELLDSSKAGEAAQMLSFLCLKTDEQMLEMCKFLLYSPEATEGQIMWKCRQILGRE